jgi:asparagine synthase (glutamine-hydrolysing)
MCGFTGCFSFQNISSQDIDEGNKLAVCRGPDNQKNISGSEGINFDLWFNRLSIIDLNDNANQPMVSSSLNSLIMFNGEIYNSNKLRQKKELKSYDFKTSHSDTETLLAGLEISGIEFINNLEGQFSFIYWNKQEKKIFFVKDRLGQKPLYFNLNENTITFASNLKSILKILKNNNVNDNYIKQYIAYGVVFSPNTIFDNIHKVEPGHYLEIDYTDNILKSTVKKYWQPFDFIENKKFSQEEFLDIFSESVEKRLVSDVPIASFLSGGLDSTSIVKKISELGHRVNTFSVVVDKSEINEESYIKEVVSKYSTNHSQIKVESSISSKNVFEALDCLDEPYGDPSIVPSFLLSKLISQDFKVAISGDGGDELLGGYSRMKNHLVKRSKLKNLYSKLYKTYPPLFGTGTRLKSFSSDFLEAHKSYIEDEKLVNLLFDTHLNSQSGINFIEDNSLYKSVLINEYKYYLSEQMMFKVDRASMANSLEVRSPLVDNKLVEYILNTSHNYISKETQKLPLVDYLKEDFDSLFLNRPKQGFVFDYQTWVFENFNLVSDIIDNSVLNKYFYANKIYMLNKFKTRISALRIWRIFVLANYLNSIKSL